MQALSGVAVEKDCFVSKYGHDDAVHILLREKAGIGALGRVATEFRGTGYRLGQEFRKIQSSVFSTHCPAWNALTLNLVAVVVSDVCIVRCLKLPATLFKLAVK